MRRRWENKKIKKEKGQWIYVEDEKKSGMEER